MKSLLLLLTLGVIAFTGCSTPFQLEADIEQFPNKISRKDTLILIVDQSVCMSRTVDRSTITSNGNHPFIQTEISDDYLNKKVLQKEVYNSQEDSLNIEDLLYHMHKYGTNHRENSSPFITVIHKGDTIRYYSLSLTKKLGNADYYNSIMRRIYPNEKNYQPVIPPKAD